MKIKNTYKTYLLVLILISLVIRAPFLMTLNLGVAPIENYNIGRNLADHGQLYASIKSNFFDAKPIIHSPLGDREIVYPVFVSLLIKFGCSYQGIQIVNTMLACLIVGLLFLLFSHYFGMSVGFWAALLISCNQFFVRMSIIATEDILFLLIITLTFVAFCLIRESWVKIIILGIASGLAFITRNAGIFLFLSIASYYAVVKRMYSKTMLLSGVFISAIIPFFWSIASANGSLLSWLATDCIKRFDHDAGLWLGLHYQIPTFSDFLKNNAGALVKKNVELFYSYLKGIVDFKYLSFLSIFLLKIKASHFKQHHVIALFIFAILSLLIFTTFLNGSDEYRFLLPSFIFLLPFALVALKDLRIPFRIAKLKTYHRKISFYSMVSGIILFIYLTKLVLSFSHLSEENYFQASIYQRVCDWARNQTSPNTYYAATIPWVVNLLTDRPTAILPAIQTKADLVAFVGKYHIQYLIVDTGFRPYGQQERYGGVFLERTYPIIKQESPELLKLMFHDSYYQHNQKFEIVILEVNQRSASCSDSFPQPAPQSVGDT